MECKGIFVALLFYNLVTSDGVVSGMDCANEFDCIYEEVLKPNTPWIIKTPVEAMIKLDCFRLRIPGIDLNPDRCHWNHSLKVYYLKEEKLSNSQSFCQRPFVEYYQTDMLVLEFQVDRARLPALLECNVTALYNEPPTTPPPCDCGRAVNSSRTFSKFLFKTDGQKALVTRKEEKVNHYPFSAALVRIIKNHALDYTVRCGSVIVSNRYALCTANCMPSDDLSNYGLLVGEHRILTDAETNATDIYKIRAFMKHEYYLPWEMTKSYINDIALIKTRNEIRFSLSVAPACLPHDYQVGVTFVGYRAKAIGWNINDEKGGKSDVNVTVVSNDYCLLNHSSRLFSMSSTTICAYSAYNSIPKSEPGDPLVWHNENIDRYVLIGIFVSGGKKKPRIYTRLTPYINWILETIDDNRHCPIN